MTTPLSSCCKAPVKYYMSDGTDFHCRKCGKPCSIEEPKTYARDYSHIHCWNQVHEFHQVLPDCGIPLEKHTQCCLCDVKYSIDLEINIVGRPPASTGNGVEGKTEYQKQYEWKKRHYFEPMVQILLRDPAFWEVIRDTVHAHENSDQSLPTTNQTIMTHKTPVNASAVEEELKGLPERVLERTKLIYPAYDHLMLMDGFKTYLRWQIEAILKDEVDAIIIHASTLSDSTLREGLRKALLWPENTTVSTLDGDSRDLLTRAVDFVTAHHTKEMDELAKAFGGCKKCYGKGYSTVLEHVSGGHGGSEIFEQLPRMHFCLCERGESLKSEITLLTTYKK